LIEYKCGGGGFIVSTTVAKAKSDGREGVSVILVGIGLVPTCGAKTTSSTSSI
jgi:predicted secreted protein